MRQEIKLNSVFATFCVLVQLLFAGNAHAYGFYENFTDLQIVDQDNQRFSTQILDNKITLFNFIYTNCASVCAVQTMQLSKLYRQLDPAIKQDIRFVSVSLDPVKDKPKRLKQFAKNNRANLPDWHFLALDFTSLTRLSRRLVLFKENYGKTVYDSIEHIEAGTNNNQYKLEEHSLTLWLIGPSGQVRQRYIGKPVDVARLAREMKALHNVEFKH